MTHCSLHGQTFLKWCDVVKPWLFSHFSIKFYYRLCNLLSCRLLKNTINLWCIHQCLSPIRLNSKFNSNFLTGLPKTQITKNIRYFIMIKIKPLILNKEKRTMLARIDSKVDYQAIDYFLSNVLTNFVLYCSTGKYKYQMYFKPNRIWNGQFYTITALLFWLILKSQRLNENNIKYIEQKMIAVSAATPS